MENFEVIKNILAKTINICDIILTYEDSYTYDIPLDIIDMAKNIKTEIKDLPIKKED